MFRQIAVIFLLFAFVAQIFNRALIVLDYYTNTASFAENCENKARPNLHCNGQCQMRKKLKEEEKKEEQNPNRKSDTKDEVINWNLYFTTLALFNLPISELYSSWFDTSFPKGVYADIFHPPASLV